MRWKIYYIDNTKFSNEDGTPQDAPGGGVGAVVQEDSHVGVVVHHQNDFYVFDEQYGGWYGLDYFGFSQYVAKPGHKIIKMGESMTTEGYRRLIASLQDDPGLPSKSARYPWEVPS